jgi:hypothetical protein
MVDCVALLTKKDPHATDSVKRSPGVLLIKKPHQLQVIFRHSTGLIVEARSVKAQELTLPYNGKLFVIGLYEPSFLINSYVQTFF